MCTDGDRGAGGKGEGGNEEQGRSTHKQERERKGGRGLRFRGKLQEEAG